MICSACGKQNADGVTFCEFCGVNAKSTVSGVTSHPTPPTAADVAQMGKSILAALTLGEKFIIGGVIVSVLGFFLPFLNSPDLGILGGLIAAGSGADLHASISLFGATRVLGAIYFLLLAAIVSGVLVYWARKAPYSKKLFLSGFQVMIGSLFGPVLVVAFLFVPMIQSVTGSGYWLFGLGYCAIAAGGLITIHQISRAIR